MKYLSASYQIKKSHTLTKNSNHRDGPTDVLAFSLGEAKDEIIADIFVSTMAATKNACAFHTSPLFETYLYCVHGVLHCLGFDDGTPARRLIMRRAEKNI